MSIEELIKAYKELGTQIEALEKQKKALSAEILQLIPKDTKSLRVDEYMVRRYTRLSIKTSLESAKVFGAFKTEEVVDKDKIKQLFHEGHLIPDVSEIQFLQVSRVPDKT